MRCSLKPFPYPPPPLFQAFWCVHCFLCLQLVTVALDHYCLDCYFSSELQEGKAKAASPVYPRDPMGRSQCIVRCFEGVNQALLALGSPWDIVYPVAAGLGNGFAEEEGWSLVERIASAGFRQEHQNGEDSVPFCFLDTPCFFNMV